MEKQIIITYNVSDKKGGAPPPEHVEAVTDTAEDQIFDSLFEGIRSGKLTCYAGEGENRIKYTGFFGTTSNP